MPLDESSAGLQESSSTNDDTVMQQSPSSAAEATSAAFKEFARGRPASTRSSTSSSISNKSFRSVRESGPGVEGSSPQPTKPRRLAPAPSISPASNVNSNSSPTNSSDGSGTETRNPFASDKEPCPEDERATKLPRLPPIPPLRSSPRGRPLMKQVTSNDSRLQIPKTVSDLGRDYSRYPLPSQRNSLSTPPTPASRHSAGEIPLPSPRESEHLSVPTQLGHVTETEKQPSLYLDDRLASNIFAGDAGNTFPLYLDEKELDDDLHNPQPGDERSNRPTLRDFLSLRQLASFFGLVFMIIGLLCVFILLPVLSYTGHAIYDYPYHSRRPDPVFHPSESWAHVNDVKYPIFRNIRTGLIDPQTPASARIKKSVDGVDLKLVFSDEFSTANRTFYPGDDPYWTAPDIWYGATQDMEWYDPDAVTTDGGTLTLRLDQFPNHDLLYRSGMLNSWNQFCMKGGSLDVSVSLPGPGGASGLWPGIWTMGNLGRPGYKASTEGLWPYTYDSCDVGITANQSMDDGTSYLVGQKLPSCTCPGEDHPTPGRGRGAPEIDVFEASADPTLHIGLVTQSYQVAPYDIWWRPDNDFLAIPNINLTQMNGYCGGPYQQALSAQTMLNNNWYDGEAFQTYGFEYTPGSMNDGKITWSVADKVSFMMTGNAIGPNGNIDARPISEEPMSIVLNVGFSTAWTGIKMEELKFPTTMYVDYVRIYQPPGRESITCDPPGYETTEYIKNHPSAYHNPNLTLWSQTGYDWPKNRLTTNC